MDHNERLEYLGLLSWWILGEIVRHRDSWNIMNCISEKSATKTNIRASTSPNRGAVQPSISPGERGFIRGIVASYFPDQNEEYGTTPSLEDILDWEWSKCLERSSLSRCKAETNCIVDTNAKRVSFESDSEEELSPLSMSRFRLTPILLPIGIWALSSSKSNRFS